MRRILENIKKMVRGEWRYRGITNSLMNKHEWTDGTETVSVFQMNGAGQHAGYVVEVTGRDNGATLKLSNGFVSFTEALVLADMHMREDDPGPAAFMHSDRVQDDHAPGSSVRQDTWLGGHAHDYEFAVVNPERVGR